MRVGYHLNRKSLASVLVALSIASLIFLSSAARASAAPTGANFDHIVIIAMENQHYSNVLGGGTLAGCPIGTAAFLCGMLPFSSTVPNYHSYGAKGFSGDSISGCSAACYVALMSGDTHGVSDGYGCCLSGTTLVDEMQSAGLTWQAYCEAGCPRGNDHFPFTGFASDVNSPNIFTGSSVSTSGFVAAANSASPPNLLWFTPTDSHNMHDVSISTGDSYLQQFLVGSGSLQSPGSGSLLGSSLFTNPSYHTLLYIWWDEYDPSPNVLYGSMIKMGYVSASNTYDEYASLHTIENNWGLSALGYASSAPTMSDIFGSNKLSASFTYLPLTPVAGVPVSFTAVGSGGTLPYTSSWSFGDGTTGTSLTATHTYTSPGNYSIVLTVTDAASGTATSTQTAQVVSAAALSASFSYSPIVPVSGQNVTFTAKPTGGTSPYSYSWSLGGTIKTGSPVSGSFKNGTYTVSLTVTDSLLKTAVTSQSLTVLPLTSGSVPVLIGWGGVGLGESLSDIQVEMQTLSQSGYNTLRVAFEPTCTTPPDGGILGSYDMTKMGQVIGLAKQYNLWIIVDYHGYTELESASTQQCWLTFWKSLVGNFTSSYSQIIWEPLNEPHMTSNTDVAGLSSGYQAVINEVRALGDTHWIVVQSMCSASCGFSDSNMVAGYPMVTDPLGNLSQGGRIFISLHSYMGYQWYSSSWNNATADTLAREFLNAVVTGMKTTGWPALNTEGGTSTGSQVPPDEVLTGSAGYSVVSFHFAQTLTNLYDANTPQRINWVWWTEGSWTNTPGAGTLGSLQCNTNPIGWGCLLAYVPVGPLPPPPPVSSAKYTLSFQGYDFDGANEETLTMNGALIASIPPVLTTANGAKWISFSFNITSFIVRGTNTISFTHANFDCAYVDQVRNLVVTNQTRTVYSNMTVENVNTLASCTNSLLYIFTTLPDFSISSSSPSAVNIGQSAMSIITTVPLNGFTGTIFLTHNLPSGLTCGPISPATLSGSGTATVSCNATVAGTYRLAVIGTSGALSNSAVATFTVNKPDFSITASTPGAVSVGQSSATTITITALAGFTATVSLTDTVPNGLSCGNISNISVIGSGTASVTCSAINAGSYVLTITGTSGSLSHSATATFNFRDFSLSANPSSLSINTGGQGTSTVGLNLLNGFGSSVALSVSNPTGITASLSTSTISGSGTSTLTISPATLGSYTVVVVGTSGSLTRTISLIVSVGTQPSPVLTALSAETVVQTSTVSFTVTATDPSAPTRTLTLSANQLPSGASFSQAQGTSSVSSKFAWTPTAADAPGTYTVSFTVTDGVSSAQTYAIITVVSANVLPIIRAPGPVNATVGTLLHFIVSATDPTGTGGAVILSATGLAPNMALDSASGTFSFTPSSSQAGGIYTVSFTASDSNDPSWTRTQSVPIHVLNSSSQPSGGGFCLSCLLPRGITTSAWLLTIGSLVGIISTIIVLHIRAAAELATAKRRMTSLQEQTQLRRTYGHQPPRRRVAQDYGKRNAVDDE